MLNKIVYFVLLYSGVLSSNSFVNAEAACGHEILEHRLDHLYHNLTKQVTHLEETLEIKLNNLLRSISSNKNSSKNAVDSGNYQLKLSSKSPLISVYCDMESFLGGWLVIQQRTDGSVSFIRTWREYQAGFGTVGESTEFWMGLDILNRITASGEYELVIELISEVGKYGFARYKDFRIAGEYDLYRMSNLGDYSGTIGDGLRPNENSKFSTIDSDNDSLSYGSCSLLEHSGAAWWYNECGESSLNGPYHKNENGFAISWSNWCNAATFSRMMIRRK